MVIKLIEVCLLVSILLNNIPYYTFDQLAELLQTENIVFSVFCLDYGNIQMAIILLQRKIELVCRRSWNCMSDVYHWLKSHSFIIK